MYGRANVNRPEGLSSSCDIRRYVFILIVAPLGSRCIAAHQSGTLLRPFSSSETMSLARISQALYYAVSFFLLTLDLDNRAPT